MRIPIGIAAIAVPLVMLGTAASATPAAHSAGISRPYTVTVAHRGHRTTVYRCERSPVGRSWRAAGCIPVIHLTRNPHLTAAARPATCSQHCDHTATFELPHASGCAATVSTVLRGTVYDVTIHVRGNTCFRYIRGYMQCNYFVFHHIITGTVVHKADGASYMECPHGALTSLQNVGIQWKKRRAAGWRGPLVIVRSYS